MNEDEEYKFKVFFCNRLGVYLCELNTYLYAEDFTVSGIGASTFQAIDDAKSQIKELERRAELLRIDAGVE